MTAKKITPAMQQYKELKKVYPDALLFFRMGDFYELFDDDAHIVAKVLGLTLTARNKKSEYPQPMAGLPYHARDKYTADLLKQGYKVAIAEQISDPALPGIVQRQITEVLTPGTTVQDEVLQAKEHAYIATIHTYQGRYGLAYLDVSTGEFAVTEAESLERMYEEVERLRPRELVLAEDVLEGGDIAHDWEGRQGVCVSFCTPLMPEDAERVVFAHFEQLSKPSPQIPQTAIAAKRSASTLLAYVQDMGQQTLAHVTSLVYYHIGHCMQLSGSTLRNLELFHTSYEGTKEGSLLWVLDHTATSAGGRLLRSWMLEPLLQREEIEKRYEVVSYWHKDPIKRKEVRTLLKATYDLERIIAKVVYAKAHARDLLSMRDTLLHLEELSIFLKGTKELVHQDVLHAWKQLQLEEIKKMLLSALDEDAPASRSEIGMIKEGYDTVVDELRGLVLGGKEWILRYQQELQKELGISSLKVQFNKVFGYYIEVTKANASKVPSSFERKQTLTNAERFTTPVLKEYETKVLTAEADLLAREQVLFEACCQQIMTAILPLQEAAKALAKLDVLVTFAEVAHRNNYTRPTLEEGYDVYIEEGRHPVIEHIVHKEQKDFVPNSLCFQHGSEEMHIITGPNMAGKSTFLRQNALIILLAQIGSFVPAKNARLGVVDQIYTRIGAHDQLSKGLSTFMVEMKEAAHILKYATERSFIILDEIGRGTSTYDGLSLAWGIVSYIHTTIRAKTLFATHYHELIELSETLPRVVNYSVAVSETKDGVVFLRKITKGGIAKSYGIDVAKIAGLPKEVIDTALTQLQDLEIRHKHISFTDKGEQLSFFSAPQIIEKEVIKTSPIEESLRTLRPEKMSPLEALKWIYDQQHSLENAEDITQ